MFLLHTCIVIYMNGEFVLIRNGTHQVSYFHLAFYLFCPNEVLQRSSKGDFEKLWLTKEYLKHTETLYFIHF